MKYKYGEVILESKDSETINEKMMECLGLGYKQGDTPMEGINTEKYSYALIVNSDNYIDVEYKVPVIEYTYVSKSELKEIK